MTKRETQSKRAAEKKHGQNPSAKRNQRSQALEGGENKESRTGITRRESYTPARTGSPFAFMRRFSEEMERLFGDFGFGRDWLTPAFSRDFDRLGELDQSMWSPRVELLEREGKLIVRADLPGLSKDDVKVDIANNAIEIRGERRQEREESQKGYYRTERSYGSFYRNIPLPDGINADDANATFLNGVLEITMPAPAKAEQRSRRLEVSDKSTSEEEPRSHAKAAGR